MTAQPPAHLRRYVTCVIAGGVAVVTAALVTASWPTWSTEQALITVILLGGLIAGEWMPVQISRGDNARGYTFSGPFTVALIVLGPLWVVLLAQGAALLADELRQRRKVHKAAFNLSQYFLGIAGGRAFYSLATDQPFGSYTPDMTEGHILAAIGASAVYFLVNAVLVSVVLALANNEPLLPSVVGQIHDEMSMTTMLLCTAPIVVIALQFSILTAPLCVLPIAAVRQAVRTASASDVQARHDALTGLPNRTLLLERSRRAAELAREGEQTGLLLLDLDHFKEINDTLGHQVGDELLRLVAARLSYVVREGDTVARFGGDEFAVLCPGLPDAEQAEGLSQRLIDALAEPFALEQIALHVEASVGIALLPQHASGVEQLVQRADVALYQAKAERGTARTYDPQHDYNSVERLALMEELRSGLETQLLLHYQPKCRATDGALVGVEALVRWQHPRLGVLQPESFIPAAENTGLIVPMTMHILRESLHQVRRWRDVGLNVNVAVNISPRHLSAVDLPDHIAALLAEAELPGRALTLEVTESSIMSDPERAAQVLRRIRALDVAVSIDDFGTGYSSLAYLRELSATEVKIDRTFVQHARTNARDRAIVKAAVDLGHSLDLRVVAEGVDDLATVQVMARCGCDLVQGNAILPPVPAIELSSWSDRPRLWGRASQIDLGRRRQVVDT